jgi:hypothetical protein
LNLYYLNPYYFQLSSSFNKIRVSSDILVYFFKKSTLIKILNLVCNKKMNILFIFKKVTLLFILVLGYGFSKFYFKQLKKQRYQVEKK